MVIAVYAGSFDPVTSGHLFVARQAARLFDHVRILVAVNPEKQALLTLEERVALLREAVGHLPNVSVASTGGLVVDHVREIGASVLIRGIRDADDAAQEVRLAQLNRLLNSEAATVFVPAPPELTQISSTDLKERIRRGEDVSGYCPSSVAARVRSRLLGREEKEGAA